MSAAEAAERWTGLVAEVATMPEVVERLMARHRPSPDGRCPGCTSPNSGLPAPSWPCTLYALAVAASVHDGRRLRAVETAAVRPSDVVPEHGGPSRPSRALVDRRPA